MLHLLLAQFPSQSVGAEAIIDAVVSDTPIFIRTSQPSSGKLAGSLVVVNAQLNNVPVAVGVLNQTQPVLPGTSDSMTIPAWAQGNAYKGSSTEFNFTQGSIEIPKIPASLLDSDGRIIGRGCPQYEHYTIDQIVSAKDFGAKGDGKVSDCVFLSNHV